MQRALMQLNIYGREAVRHKGKNRQKMKYLCFQAVFANMSDSLTTIQVKLHQCHLHQSILLTQGPIHEIFTKKNLRIGNFEKLSFFEYAILDFLLHPLQNQSKLLKYQGWVETLMITLVSSQKPPRANISVPSVTTYFLNNNSIIFNP